MNHLKTWFIASIQADKANLKPADLYRLLKDGKYTITGKRQFETAESLFSDYVDSFIRPTMEIKKHSKKVIAYFNDEEFFVSANKWTIHRTWKDAEKAYNC